MLQITENRPQRQFPKLRPQMGIECAAKTYELSPTQYGLLPDSDTTEGHPNTVSPPSIPYSLTCGEALLPLGLLFIATTLVDCLNELGFTSFAPMDHVSRIRVHWATYGQETIHVIEQSIGRHLWLGATVLFLADNQSFEAQLFGIQFQSARTALNKRSCQ